MTVQALDASAQDRERGVLAIELFNDPPSLDALMADLPPLSSLKDLTIPDVTDEEWEPFVEALKD